MAEKITGRKQQHSDVNRNHLEGFGSRPIAFGNGHLCEDGEVGSCGGGRNSLLEGHHITLTLEWGGGLPGKFPMPSGQLGAMFARPCRFASARERQVEPATQTRRPDPCPAHPEALCTLPFGLKALVRVPFFYLQMLGAAPCTRLLHECRTGLGAGGRWGGMPLRSGGESRL